MQPTSPPLSVAYDTRSGRIVGVHHGASEAGNEWTRGLDHDLPLAVLQTSIPEDAQGKYYAVDTERECLVETDGEHGISFGFGAVGAG